MLTACATGPELPEIPERTELTFDISVEPVYGALLDEPLNAEANGNLAGVLHRLGQHREAALFYERAHLLEPGSFRWPYYLAHAQALDGRYGAATASLRQALQINPGYRPAWLALGRSTLESGDLIQSVEAFRRLDGEGPAAALAAYWLGRIAASRREYDEVIDLFGRAVELAPEFGAGHYALALQLERVRREQEARQHFLLADRHRFIEPKPDDPLLREVYGEHYRAVDFLVDGAEMIAEGKIPEAAATFRTALLLDAGRVEAHAGLVRCYGNMRRYDESEKHYAQALEIDDRYDQAYIERGAVLLDQNRFQEAGEMFTRSIEINPSSSRALAYLGFLDEQNGDLESARRRYEQALANGEGYPEAHVRLGAVLLRLRRPGEAEREFVAALGAGGSTSQRVLYQISQVYERSGDRVAAANYLSRAREATAGYDGSATWQIEAERWPLD